MVERWKCVGYCRHCSADQDDSTFSKEWGHFEKSSDGAWVRADAALALAAELAECRDSRQREHDLRVALAGELESFKIRYQDEVYARVDVENDRDTLRTGYVSELRKARADLALAGKVHAVALDLLRRVEKRRDEHIRKEIRFYLDYGIGSPSRQKILSTGSALSEGEAK